jgi:acetyl-CoA carboxylase biotin carboxyl carrier protein
VRVRELSTLVQWLKDKGIHVFEVEQPDTSVRIVMQGCREATEAIRVEEYRIRQASPKHPSSNVTANARGAFLSTHPLRTAAAVALGDTVKEGDVLGLLKVTDVLYHPVLADRKGRVMRVLAADGEMIEEGMPLFELDIGTSRGLTSLRNKDGAN